MLKVLLFWLTVVAELIGMAFSGVDYGSHIVDEYKTYFHEKEAVFSTIVDKSLEATKENDGTIELVDLKVLSKKYSIPLKKVDKKVTQRIKVWENENGEVKVDIPFTSSSPGFSSVGLYYSTWDRVFPEKEDGSVVYDVKTGEYKIYNAANYQEIYPLGDNWYFYQIAYYNNSGFQRQE